MTDSRHERRKPAPSNERSTDAFPSTAYTLLGQWLCEGGATGLELARHHVMSVYPEPLATYLRGSSFAAQLAQLNHYGEQYHATADDIVRGFFADRLSRDAFLHDWLRSERPLRFWLIVAFKHHLWELLERLERERKAHQEHETRGAQAGAMDANPERRFHRDVALALVREAERRAIDSLTIDGRADDWRVIIRHHLDGVGYRDLAEELKVTQTQAKVMSMRAATRFRRAVEELTGWPGATAEQVRQEIVNLMEAIKP